MWFPFSPYLCVFASFGVPITTAPIDQPDNKKAGTFFLEHASDDNLKDYLPKLKGKHTLIFMSPNVSNDGLKHLQHATSIKRIEFDHVDSQISDDGLLHLGKMKNLEYIDLSELKISDDGIIHLAELTNLRGLDLAMTEIRGMGFEKLR